MNKRNRIIILYSLGLVIPGIILGYLAFRGLQNDQALREKQNRQELQLMAGDIWTKLDSSILVLKAQLEQGQDPFVNSVLISWNKSTSSNPVIESGKMIYWPEGSINNSYEYFTSTSDKARTLEFARKDYAGAISEYREIADNAENAGERLNALLGLARVYKKSGDQDGAEKTYWRIADNCSDNLISSHLPACGLSLLEIIKIRKLRNDGPGVKKVSDQFLEFLVNPPVLYEQTAFDYLLEEWRTLVSASDSLDKELSEAVKLTELLSRWHEMSPGLFSEDDKIKYLESNDYPALFLQSTLDSISRGWAVDLQIVFGQIIPEIINDLEDQGELSWAVKTNVPALNLGDRLVNPVELNFPAGYPPWKLQLERNQKAGLSGLFETSQGVLLLVFVFIIILMIAGLVFMLNTLSQEMKLSRMKSSFISNVSHEFKTPLTSIRHMTEIMHLKRIDSEERMEEYLQSMLEQCDHLGHLVDNILDFSRIEEDVKNYRFETYHLDEILEKLIPVFQRRIDDDDFEISLEIENPIPEMMLDKDAMLQVFFNLLDNAYKYSRNSKKIEIKVHQAPAKNQQPATSNQQPVTIEVRDWGLGIEEKDLSRIFERFYRGDKLRTAAIKGSGIGLTIVKKIVEAHGGRIEVESELNNGSTFRVILPVKN